MEDFEQIINTISMTMGAAWGSGINLYATVLVLGLLGVTENIILPENLEILMNPLVIGAAGLMYFVEFFADKVPGVDTGWDSLHTFVRIPAGVMLAAGAGGCRSNSRRMGCFGSSLGVSRADGGFYPVDGMVPAKTVGCD